MHVELVVAEEADKPVLANLLQLYLHDLAGIRDLELSPHGTYGYRYLDHYFDEPEQRDPWFVKADGRLAGLALARHNGDMWTVAEFFVVRRHRRRGVAKAAATLLFATHPGPWSLLFDQINAPAAGFWTSLLPDARQHTELYQGTPVTQLVFQR